MDVLLRVSFISRWLMLTGRNVHQSAGNLDGQRKTKVPVCERVVFFEGWRLAYPWLSHELHCPHLRDYWGPSHCRALFSLKNSPISLPSHCTFTLKVTHVLLVMVVENGSPAAYSWGRCVNFRLAPYVRSACGVLARSAVVCQLSITSVRGGRVGFRWMICQALATPLHQWRT